MDTKFGQIQMADAKFGQIQMADAKWEEEGAKYGKQKLAASSLKKRLDATCCRKRNEW